MKLGEYIEQYGTTYTFIARKAKVSHTTIKRILDETSDDVKFSLALKIEAITNGEVTPIELLPKATIYELEAFFNELRERHANKKATKHKNKNY